MRGYLCRAHWLGGVAFGFSQMAMFGVYALCFWAGAKFIVVSAGPDCTWPVMYCIAVLLHDCHILCVVQSEHMKFEDMIRVFFAIAMAGIGASWCLISASVVCIAICFWHSVTVGFVLCRRWPNLCPSS